MSKHTPLPARVTRGAVGVPPAEIDEARGVRARPAHRVDRGVAVRDQLVAGDGRALRPEAVGEGARRLEEVPGEEVAGRGVDEVADEGDGLDLAAGAERGAGIGAKDRPLALPLLSPVAIEAVGPEPPSDRDPFEVGGLEPGPDPVPAGGEGGGKVRAAPWIQGVRGVRGAGDPDQHRTELVARVRHEAAGMGACLEAGGPHPAASRLRLPLEPLLEAVLVDEVDGNPVGSGRPAVEV